MGDGVARLAGHVQRCEESRAVGKGSFRLPHYRRVKCPELGYRRHVTTLCPDRQRRNPAISQLGWPHQATLRLEDPWLSDSC
jgi:hypothetical protein